MKLKDKLMNASINMRQFYTLGIICFLIVAVASIYTSIVSWNYLDLGSKVSTIFRAIFNFGIVFFFNFLRKTLPPKQKEEDKIDIDNMIEKSGL